jgi:hypothetical protein
MPKTQPKEIAHPPLTDSERVTRGRAVDEMQQRMADLKRHGKEVPAEWTERLAELSDAVDHPTLNKHLEWMHATLPPKEYLTEEITWQTFAHFSSALLDRLTIYAMRHHLLGNPETGAADIMKEIIAIRGATDSPVVAMNELAKSRAKAASSLNQFTVEG